MKFRFLSICLCLAVILPTVGFAVTTDFTDVEIEYNRTTGLVSISGDASFKENSDESVRLMILKPNTDLDKLNKGELTFITNGVHVDEILTADGNFVFDGFVIPVGSEPGAYIVRIATENKVYTDLIPVATSEQAKELMNDATAENVAEYIELYNDVYGLDVAEGSLYASFENEGKTFVASKLAGETYADNEALKKEFNIYTALYKIKKGPWGTLEKAVIPNAEILELDLTSYNSLSSGEKDKVFKALSGNLYQNKSELKSAFDEAVKNAKKKNKDTSSGGSGSSVSWSGSTAGKVDEVQPSVPAIAFDDLSNHLWAKDSIIKLYDKGIVSGKANRNFAPDDCLTRAEAAKILVLAFGKADEEATCNFEDVEKSSWMYTYIATAYENGIIKGYEDNTAGVNDDITREDFCVMILRAVKNADIELNVSADEIIFDDGKDVSEYAKDAVKALQKAGIVNGKGENQFLPKADITRAEAAKIVGGLVG